MRLLWLSAHKHHHTCHFVRARDMRDVKALHTVGQRVQIENFGKLNHRALRSLRLSLFLCAVLGHSVVCVGMCKFKQLFSHALLWLDHSHRVRAKPVYRVFKTLCSLHAIGDDLIAKGRVVLIVLQDIACNVFVCTLRYDVFAANELSAAHDKHIDCRHNAVCLKSEYIEIEIFWQRAHLLLHEFVQ